MNYAPLTLHPAIKWTNHCEFPLSPSINDSIWLIVDNKPKSQKIPTAKFIDHSQFVPALIKNDKKRVADDISILEPVAKKMSMLHSPPDPGGLLRTPQDSSGFLRTPVEFIRNFQEFSGVYQESSGFLRTPVEFIRNFQESIRNS